MQLRYMQTLTDIAGDKSSTIVFPLPMDLIEPLLVKLKTGLAERQRRQTFFNFLDDFLCRQRGVIFVGQ